FAEAGGNAVLAKLIRNARITTRLFEIVSPFQRVREDAAEHLAILDAFSRHSRRATAEAMLRHLRNLEAAVASALTGGPLSEPRASPP
ncbi:MAG: FCD domain-containing protein, partial [Acetobacteraceae bacterium]